MTTDKVILHPDDVEVRYGPGGKPLGYAVSRSVLIGDGDMIVLGEQLATAARATLTHDGEAPVYKLLGDVINALNQWDAAMAERFNRDIERH